MLAGIQGHNEQHIIATYQQQGSATAAALHRRGVVDNPMWIDSNPDIDNDDFDVDGNFDLNSYLEECRISRANLDGNTDSQVTLTEVSVVELNVSDDEFAALIDLHGADNTEDKNDPLHTSTNQLLPSRRRVSRRLRDKHDTLNNATVQMKQ